MRRRFEWLVPAGVLLGTVLAAIVVNVVLAGAQSSGVDALEQSVTGEVQAIAASQNQRFLNTFSAAAGLSSGLTGEPYELTVGSAMDLEELNRLLALVVNTRSGFYLLDNQDTITQGVLFTGDPVGTRFSWPGLAALQRSAEWERGAVLPVSKGYTTDQPVFVFVLPIFEQSATGQLGSRRGTFVFEQVVAVDSDFNKEIGQLKRGATGTYLFYDDHGTVIASNDPALIGRALSDKQLSSATAGLHRFSGNIVVIADVPDAGWRVAFREDSKEFEEPLTGPLQSVGLLFVLVLLAGGALFTLLILRRLQAARAEQERLRLLGEAQQEFISIVSHELRTPVAGVLGFLETSLDHWDLMDDEERHLAVRRAASNARRLQSMARDVLDTQTIESGKMVQTLTRLDLAAEARVAVEAAREVDPNRRIDLTLPDGPVWIEADTDRLQQVFANLIDNARRVSLSLDPVEVAVSGSGDTAVVAVTDSGTGIPEESLERIFDKFVRGRGDSVSGTGLGLYISRQIIGAHNGRIWAENSPERGAVFRFELPLSGSVTTPQKPSAAKLQ